MTPELGSQGWRGGGQGPVHVALTLEHTESSGLAAWVAAFPRPQASLQDSRLP